MDAASKKTDVYTALVTFCTSHKVCKASATRSKSSMSWFYGFKVHAIINHESKIVRIFLSKAILDDRKGLKAMAKGFKGTIISDKGYLVRN